ncbi:MAG: hypothetical protein ACLF0P_15605 [Thermoanaerobaculia bacterium]
MFETLQNAARPLRPVGPFVNLKVLAGEEPEPRVDEDDREDPPKEEEGAEQEPTVDPPDKDIDGSSAASR